MLGLVLRLAWAFARVFAGRLAAAAPAVLLLAFGLRQFDAHTKWALLLAVLVLVALALAAPLAARLRGRGIPA